MMAKRSTYLLVYLFCISLLVLPACFPPEEGALSQETRTELNSFAAKTVSIEKKYIKLVEKMALLLEEVNEIPDDNLAMDRLRKFYADDQYALKQINRELNSWYRYASQEDISNFLKAVDEQPSSRRLRQLVPALRNRFSYNLDWARDFNLLFSFLDLQL